MERKAGIGVERREEEKREEARQEGKERKERVCNAAERLRGESLRRNAGEREGTTEGRDKGRRRQWSPHKTRHCEEIQEDGWSAQRKRHAHTDTTSQCTPVTEVGQTQEDQRNSCRLYLHQYSLLL